MALCYVSESTDSVRRSWITGEPATNRLDEVLLLTNGSTSLTRTLRIVIHQGRENDRARREALGSAVEADPGYYCDLPFTTSAPTYTTQSQLCTLLHPELIQLSFVH